MKSKFKDFEIVFENMIWKVRMVDAVVCVIETEAGSVEAHGYCDANKREIVVCIKDKHIHDIKVTLAHELAHMMLNLVDMGNNKLYDSELTAELLGRGMASIMWQLPKWFYTL